LFSWHYLPANLGYSFCNWRFPRLEAGAPPGFERYISWATLPVATVLALLAGGLVRQYRLRRGIRATP
jgi:hypothetical protein